MKHFGNMRRATGVLLLLLSCLSFGRVTAQSADLPPTSRGSVVIRGTIEVPTSNPLITLELASVILKGFPGNLITDRSGRYEITVEKGWSGTVTPVREGYTFEPPKYVFEDVTSDLVVSFVAKRIAMWVISGSAGAAGVRLTGLPGSPVSDSSGSYRVTLPDGWSGIVTPVKEGIVFVPPARRYDNLSRDEENEDYSGTVLTFMIGGSTGVPGVTIRGFPEEVVTDQTGQYHTTVQYGWAGTIQPRKEGFYFSPPSVRYNKVSSDVENGNYTGSMITFKVSGSTGVAGVTLEGFPDRVVSDQSGRYETRVFYGWSGAVMLRKDGVKFRPPGRPYNNVKRDYTDHDYIPETPPAIPRQVPSQSNIMVVPTQEVRPDQLTAISEDLGVMLHILKRETAADRPDRGGVVFSDFGDFFKAQRPSFEALYLQGHGVLFFLEAEFDMASMPEPDQAPPSADATHVDPVWQSARRAMLTPKGAAPKAAPRSTQLSADELVSRIIPTLKHAANIRFLGAPETITIRVLKKDPAMAARGFAMYGGGGTMMMDELYGGGYGGGGGGYGAAGATIGGGGYLTTTEPQESQPSRANQRARSVLDSIRTLAGARTSPPPAANTLTLHVLKSDVDDFAQGKITLAEFKRRVKVLKY